MSEDTETQQRERRQVTVLFCDLSGSTVLSSRLDPEDFEALIGEYRAMCRRHIAELEGEVVQETGDDVVACFGLHAAREDDAVRAVRAALEVVRGVAALDLPGEVSLHAKVGIATGPVVVTDGAITGEAPYLAAKLQRAAGPDTVIAEPCTRRLIAPHCELSELGEQALDGVDAALALWRVVDVLEPPTRFHATVQRVLTPFVGREEELGLLAERWARACSGAGQVVEMHAEAGAGKSRLSWVFSEERATDVTEVHRLQCNIAHRNTALHPLVEFLRRAVDAAAPNEDEPAARLAAFLDAHGVRDPLAPWLYASLLGLPLGGLVAPDPDPEQIGLETERLLLELLCPSDLPGPLLILVEDVHWGDATTFGLLRRLGRRIAGAPVLLLITYRPDCPPVFPDAPHATVLELAPLRSEESAKLVDFLTAEQPIATSARALIVERSDGVPLYLEELTRSVLQRVGVGAELSEAAVPETLQSLLRSRLDDLPPPPSDGSPVGARSLAQAGAVIGRQFSSTMLRAVLDLGTASQRSFDTAVVALLESDLVTEGRDGLRFRHALIQQEAYDSLARDARRRLHARVAEACLVLPVAETSSDEPETISFHLEAAGEPERAVPYRVEAGHRAARRSSNAEAEHHFEKALATLDAMPDSPERTRTMLEVANGLGAVRMASRGFADALVESTYRRALSIGASIGQPTRPYFAALSGMQLVRIVQGRHAEAVRLGRECLAIARSRADSALLIEAHRHLGAALWWVGELKEAREHFEAIGTLYDESAHTHLRFTYGSDPQVGAFIFASFCLTFLGQTRLARQRADEGLALARRLRHHHSECYALLGVAMLHDLQRRTGEAASWARRAVALCEEHGIPFWQSWARFIDGYASLVADGRADGIERMRRSLGEFRETGARVAHTYFRGRLADAYRRLGDPEAGLAQVDDALRLADAHGERCQVSDLLRLKAQLVLECGGDRVEAADLARAAIDDARAHGMRLIELRASTLLAAHGLAPADPLAVQLAALGDDADGPDVEAAAAQLGR